MMNTDYSHNGNPRSFGFIEKADIDELARREIEEREFLGSNTYKWMRDRFRLENKLLKQYPGFAGMVFFRSKNVEELLTVAEKIEASDLRVRVLDMHLTRDLMFLYKLVRMKTSRGLKSRVNYYVDRRLEYSDVSGKSPEQLQDFRNALEELHNIVGEAVAAGSAEGTTSVVEPNSGRVVFYPGFTWENYSESDIKRELALINSDRAVIAPAVKAPGGIDLNFQPQFIEQFSKAGYWPSREPAFANMPGEFKGFNFNIVRFTAQFNGQWRISFDV